MKSFLAVSGIWDEEPTREDVCALLRKMAAAVWDGQTSATWEGEGYLCVWITQMEQGLPGPLTPSGGQ